MMQSAWYVVSKCAICSYRTVLPRCHTNTNIYVCVFMSIQTYVFTCRGRDKIKLFSNAECHQTCMPAFLLFFIQLFVYINAKNIYVFMYIYVYEQNIHVSVFTPMTIQLPLLNLEGADKLVISQLLTQLSIFFFILVYLSNLNNIVNETNTLSLLNFRKNFSKYRFCS